MTPSVQLNMPPMSVEPLRTTTHQPAKCLRTWREMVRKAFGKSGLSAKTAASDMGITEQQLSDQLNGREKYHLSFWRMHGLPKEFWAEMVELILEFHGITAPGLTAQDQEDIRIGRQYRELQAMTQRSLVQR